MAGSKTQRTNPKVKYILEETNLGKEIDVENNQLLQWICCHFLVDTSNTDRVKNVWKYVGDFAARELKAHHGEVCLRLHKAYVRNGFFTSAKPTDPVLAAKWEEENNPTPKVMDQAVMESRKLMLRLVVHGMVTLPCITSSVGLRVWSDEGRKLRDFDFTVPILDQMERDTFVLLYTVARMLLYRNEEQHSKKGAASHESGWSSTDFKNGHEANVSRTKKMSYEDLDKFMAGLEKGLKDYCKRQGIEPPKRGSGGKKRKSTSECLTTFASDIEAPDKEEGVDTGDLFPKTPASAEPSQEPDLERTDG